MSTYNAKSLLGIVCSVAMMMSCTEDSDDQTVTTSELDNPVTIMGAGDIADIGALANATSTGDLIRNANPNFAFTLGDNAYQSGTATEYSTAYDPAWGSFKAITLPTPGNHEYAANPPASGYMSYFGLGIVSYDSSSAHLWYARDLGNGWRFYSLNTEISMSLGSPQEVWLRNDLLAHPGLHYVAVAHQPRYVSGSHTDITDVCPLWNDIQTAGGDLFLMGHEHHYERYAKMDCNGALASTGLREFVVGTGGASTYALGSGHFGQEFAQATDYGVIKLVLHETSYDWQFIASGYCVSGACPSHTGMVLDSGSAATNNGAPGGLIINRAIAAGTDDAEETASSGFMSLTSSDLELVTDGANQRVGLRFVNMTIPVGATITKAYVQFTVDETVGSTGLNLTIKGFAQDNTATFTTATNNINSRPVTTSAVTGWNPPLWTTLGAAGVDQRTPELKTVVQEIVNRPGWVSGNALGVVVTGPSGVRTAGAFDLGAGTQAVLHVEYTTSGGSNTAPTVSAGSDQTITLPASASLDGTITDDGLPNPPAAVTASWSKVSGPGTVSFGNASAVDTTATFSAAGVYVLRLTGSDSALSTSDDVQITINAGGATTIDRAIAASADDAEEVSATGFMSLVSSDLELVTEASNQRVGMRFVNMTIPKNATITKAYVQFTVDETVGSTGLNLTIKGFAQDNTATFTTATSNISSRPVTTAAVTGWNPPLWTTVGAAGVDQRTPELKTVVQEIVNRSAWASGNALGVVVTGPSGVRTARAFDFGGGTQAVLHVEYTVP